MKDDFLTCETRYNQKKKQRNSFGIWYREINSSVLDYVLLMIPEKTQVEKEIKY